MGKADADLGKDRKGAEWKVALARYLRDRVLAPNPWMAERLKMGQGSSVQSLVSRHRHKSDLTSENWKRLNHEPLDCSLSSFTPFFLSPPRGVIFCDSALLIEFQTF
jgi:hypothetical protein